MVKRCGVYSNYFPACGYSGWLNVFFPTDANSTFNETSRPYSASAEYVEHGTRSEHWTTEDGDEPFQDCFDGNKSFAGLLLLLLLVTPD